MTTITDTTLLRRNPAILAADIAGEVIMMNSSQGYFFGLDDIGSDVWQRLAQPSTFGRLVDDLAADYDADRTTIASDLHALLVEMAEGQLIEIDTAPAAAAL